MNNTSHPQRHTIHDDFTPFFKVSNNITWNGWDEIVYHHMLNVKHG